MPELAEVEVARRVAERVAVGHTIVSAEVQDDDKVVQGIAPSDLRAALAGRHVKGSYRHGKQMWLDLGDDCPALLLHYGMTGSLLVKDGESMRYGATAHADAGGVWPPKYWKLELTLENGTRMAFCDSRRFGRIRYVTDPRAHPPLSELGWDPLLSWPPLAEFQDALKKARKRTLKALLLDQGFSAGVGNWIADEALYQTRLHPEQPAGDLSDEQSAALHAAIPHICQVACDADGDSTRMPHDWLFHVRWSKRNQTKPTIDGHVIDHITVGGRTSAYVPALQRLKGHSGGPAPNVPPSEDTGAGAGAGEPKAASKRAKREKPTKEAATRARSVAKKARATSDDDGKDRRASRSGAKTSADERAKQPASGNRESSDARPERKRAGGNSGSAPGKVSPRRPSARTARSRRV